MGLCNVCQSETSKICHACQTTFYCSKQCQTQDWKKGGHKQTCEGSSMSPKEVKKVSFPKEKQKITTISKNIPTKITKKSMNNKISTIKNKFQLTTSEEIDVAGFEAILRIKFDKLAESNMEEYNEILEERRNLANLVRRHTWPSKEQVLSWIKAGNVNQVHDQIMFYGSLGSTSEQTSLYCHELLLELYECLATADDLVKVDGRMRRLAWKMKKHGDSANCPDGMFFLPIAIFISGESIPNIGPVKRKSGYKALLLHYLILKHFCIERVLQDPFTFIANCTARIIKSSISPIGREGFGHAFFHDHENFSQIKNDKMTFTTMIDHAWNTVGEWVQMPRT